MPEQQPLHAKALEGRLNLGMPQIEDRKSVLLELRAHLDGGESAEASQSSHGTFVEL